MKASRRFALISAVLVICCCLAGPAGATVFVKADDAYLVDHAELIVRAVARPVERPPAAESSPFTHYALEVLSVLRGPVAAGSKLELRVPGGIFADGSELRIFGAPRFVSGDELLLFLDRAADGSWRILHFNQGAFRLAPAGERRLAWRDFGGARELTSSGLASEDAGDLPRDLGLFTAWAADRLAGRLRPADYLVEIPQGSELAALVERYTIIYRNGRPIRWPKSAAGLEVTFYAHDVPQVGLTSGGYTEFQNAIDAWNQAGPTTFHYRNGGLTNSAAGLRFDDGTNTIVFEDYDNAGNGFFGQPFDCTAHTGILGLALTRVVGQHRFGGIDFGTIVGGDIVINKNYNCWRHFSSLNFEHTLTHELGHVAGLDHSCADDDSGPCDTDDKLHAVMRARHLADHTGARLSNDDRRAIAFLYGAPAAPTDLSARLRPNNEVELSWQDRAETEIRYRVERREESGGATVLLAELGAGATFFLDSSAAPGKVYRYLVAAGNELGASEAAEAVVATADLNAPAQLLATTTAHDRVTLSWVDRASGETGFEVWGHFLGEEERLLTLPANTTSATVDGLIADSPYRFKVRAVGLPNGNTAFSPELEVATSPAPTGPCGEGEQATCLQGERFKVEVRYRDFAGVKGQGAVAPVGSADSGVFYFFSPGNWELLVKVLDGCAINGHRWVFAAATTNVETTLIVTDSTTGKTAVYFNPLGTPAAAITDVEAFTGCPGGAAAAIASALQVPVAAPVIAAQAAAAKTVTSGNCAETAEILCLLNERYEVTVSWTDFAGHSGSGRVVPAGTADSGLFYFFSADNWELLVKVLDGCAINQQVWVFAAATTNVAYTLEVKDTVSGLVKTYRNPLGQASAAITDIAAFAACSP